MPLVLKTRSERTAALAPLCRQAWQGRLSSYSLKPKGPEIEPCPSHGGASACRGAPHGYGAQRPPHLSLQPACASPVGSFSPAQCTGLPEVLLLPLTVTQRPLVAAPCPARALLSGNPSPSFQGLPHTPCAGSTADAPLHEPNIPHPRALARALHCSPSTHSPDVSCGVVTCGTSHLASTLGALRWAVWPEA